MNTVDNQLALEFGRSEIEEDLENSEPNDLSYSQLVFSRQINRNQSLTLNYFKGVDSVLNTNSVASGSVNQQANNALAAQESKSYQLGYTINGAYLQTSLNYADRRLRQINAENADFEKQVQQSVNIRYLMSRLLNTPLGSNIELSYSSTKRGFDSDDSNGINANEIKTYGVRYNHSYSRKLSYFIAWSLREGTQQAIPTQANINGNTDTRSIQIGFVYSDRARW
jgi:hypothetical protein